MMNEVARQYIAIDLKSFYASVECVERGLNPLDVCLVVADESRTDKTICLAVSPALKAYGVPGRPRLFEVKQRVGEVNRGRGRVGTSTSGSELTAHPELEVDFIAVPPRMQLYVDYSARIFNVYLKYIAPEDIHPYSIDEVFIDVTAYLKTYKMTAHELAIKMIKDVLATTGITATAGIGTNLYLAKVAMDIVAKHIPADEDGVRIAELDEMSYRKKLWSHTPLTDFWRVGRGTARVLAERGVKTMGDLARMSLEYEDWLYHQFGVNAELLIDHAWGWEPVTMDKIKTYRPETRSLSSGQVLTEPYTALKARVVVREMADEAALQLVSKRLVTNQVVLTIGYDVESLNGDVDYQGRVKIDRYGRCVPYPAHGTANLAMFTSLSSVIVKRVVDLFDSIVNHELLVRRLTLSVNNLVVEDDVMNTEAVPTQLELFVDYEAEAKRQQAENEAHERERRRQEAILGIKRRFGKNALLKGLNYAEGATQRDRNNRIGGHKA